LESGDIKPEIIYHMGACSDTTEPSWEYLLENNLNYSKRLWNCCARDGSRLIYASSAATYGDGSNGFDDESDLSLLKPLNLYGRSKQEFDVWALEQVRNERPAPRQWVGLKFFNVFGPGESHKGRMASMVYHGFNQIKAAGSIKLFKSHRADFADGGQIRDFIYVKDVVEVMIKLGRQPEVSGIFNLGTGKARPFSDLGRALFAALGLEPNIEYVPMPEDLQGKYQYFTEAKMRKLAAAGIDHRFQSLEDSVRDYVRNHLQRGEK
jgi:ADP-L-glycero-D-manno-heptose 6-epimerase